MVISSETLSLEARRQTVKDRRDKFLASVKRWLEHPSQVTVSSDRAGLVRRVEGIRDRLSRLDENALDPSLADKELQDLSAKWRELVLEGE